ncbi:restriction system-associated AAA family ATPase [Achromobacter sp. UBA2119]|uniref:restriction system-associated AAA family ATPase n=1 Tax=Achromobacter sp. UBA2119 TaxID=1945911 RepID=UPI00257BB9BE|nr:restriction system-associated AAA family ATPase [Achromobacter sp. UBA2119]
MKLLRLKITDPIGFRSLACGFEHHFRTEWNLQNELEQANNFGPFVCAGPNGSGKSNLLEVLAAIFYHMECIYLENLPDSFRYDEEHSPNGFRGSKGLPDGFDIEYLTEPQEFFKVRGHGNKARVLIQKVPGESPKWWLLNDADSDKPIEIKLGRTDLRRLLPDFVLSYSSGENEILSLPFFKMRFVQFDEYWNALTRQLSYPGHPETRLVYLDSGFSQAILLCNLLFQDEATLQPFREDVGIDALREFRIVLRRSIELRSDQLVALASEDENAPRSLEDIVKNNPALYAETDELGNTRYRLNLLHALEANEKLQQELKSEQNSSVAQYQNFDPAITRLKRCATLVYEDESADTLVLDYWVNEATRQAFRENFDGSALALFQAFQVLLTLNLYAVSDALKADLYTSTSHYVSETVPTLASDQRIMRFKFVRFTKQGVAEPMMLKELSDGEHQLLHSLGLCLLFRTTNSLFLLDEPETHFNPDWRANFISRLRQCLSGPGEFVQEMLVTTHTPFLISDSKPDKVLVFAKDKASSKVSISHPPYNTLGASINKITHETFGKRETIGGGAQQVLEQLLADPISKADPHGLARKIMDTMGDSVERTLAVHALLQTPRADKEPG